MNELTTLSPVELREIWPNEAADFTPWLVENLSSLGDALGMELEARTREAPVGGFSLDVLAHDVGRDRTVVIENQLEGTDHDHLGKLLTYAAGYDADVVVWIARDLRDEHRQALDWLNQRTDTNSQFFGVVVEVMRIDQSRPAYNFRLVAFPNEWRKANVSSGSAGRPSERAEAYRAFFQEAIDDLREKHHFTAARVGQPQNWYSFTSGLAGYSYGISFAQGARARVDLYIDSGDRAVNKTVFDSLQEDKAAAEAEFGEALSWERLNDKRASRIAVYRAGSIDDDEETLSEIKDWMIDRVLRLKAVFNDRLRTPNVRAETP